MGLVLHMFRVTRPSLPHSAPAFLLHSDPNTALGPFAVTVKYISDQLSNVGRGVCFGFQLSRSLIEAMLF